MDMAKKGMASSDMKMAEKMHSMMANMMKMMADCDAMCKKMMGKESQEAEHDAAFAEATEKMK